jgi:hypothetical protein
MDLFIYNSSLPCSWGLDMCVSVYKEQFHYFIHHKNLQILDLRAIGSEDWMQVAEGGLQ